MAAPPKCFNGQAEKQTTGNIKDPFANQNFSFVLDLEVAA
jgi:hypothetical protein